MSNIFDLSTDYKQVYDMISQGEDSEVYLDTLDSLNDSIEDKADGYSAIIKSLNGDNEIIKKEIERLQARKKANENGIRNMKDNLQVAMEMTGKTVFRTAKNSFGIQRNKPRTDIKDETKIPKGYYNEQPMKLDKQRLLEDLQNGVEVDGVELTQDSSLRIR